MSGHSRDCPPSVDELAHVTRRGWAKSSHTWVCLRALQEVNSLMHGGHSGCSGSSHVLSTASWLHPDATLRRGVRFPKDTADKASTEGTSTDRSSPGFKRVKGGRLLVGEEEYVLLSKHKTALSESEKRLTTQVEKTARFRAQSHAQNRWDDRNGGGYNRQDGGGHGNGYGDGRRNGK